MVIGKLIIRKKQCKDCGELKTIKHFTIARERKDGLGMIYQPYCKECDSKRSKINRIKNGSLDNDLERLSKFHLENAWYGRLNSEFKKKFGKTFNQTSKKAKRQMLASRLFKLVLNDKLGKQEASAIFTRISNYNFSDKNKIYSLTIKKE